MQNITIEIVAESAWPILCGPILEAEKLGVSLTAAQIKEICARVGVKLDVAAVRALLRHAPVPVARAGWAAFAVERSYDEYTFYQMVGDDS
jgi:hypothetical protein